MKQLVLKFLVLTFIFTLFATQRASVHAGDYVEKKLFMSGPQSLAFTLIFPKELSPHATFLASMTQEAATLTESTFNLKFQDAIEIIFDFRPKDHNGLATVVPRNRIYVHLVPPALNTSIGIGEDYLKETLVHELSHMIYLQQRSGVFTIFDYIVGNLSRPQSMWPSWMHEGIAVWGESKVGGRPRSGIIDAQLRMYADYVQRNQKHPLQNSDLDGSMEWKRVEKGHLPYHFGYLLIDYWLQNNPQKVTLGKMIEDFSNNLGISFRITLRNMGYDLDKAFESARKQWAQTALATQTAVDTFEKAHQSSSSLGPYVTESHMTWITQDNKSSELNIGSKKMGSTKIDWVPWKPYRGEIENPLRINNEFILALVTRPPRHLNDFPKPFITVFESSTLDEQCHFKTKHQVTSFHFYKNQMAWIELDSSGFYTAYLTDIEPKRCRFGKATILLKSSQLLERLSGIHLGPRGWMLSMSPKRNAFKESLVINGKIIKSPLPMGSPLWLPDHLCRKKLLCLMAQAYSKNHWGPVLVTGSESDWTYAPITNKTALYSGAFDPIRKDFWVTEQTWEADTIRHGVVEFPSNTFVAFRSEPTPETTAPPLPIANKDPSDLESHGTWPSIWPHFWVPSLLFTEDGTQIAGQTFYSDTLNRWQGFTLVGYDTYVQRPMAITSLQRNFENSSWTNVSGTAYYLPQRIGSTTQDRTQFDLTSQWKFRLQNGSTFGLSPQLLYLWAQESDILTSYSMAGPGLGIFWISPKGRNLRSPLARLPHIGFGLFSSAHARWLKGLDHYERLDIHFPLWNSGFVFSSEWSQVARENYPASYIEWGGQQNLSSPQQRFLSRGFPPNFVVAKEALRLSAEWGLGVSSLGFGPDWNRLRAKHLDLRWTVESVTWESFRSQSKYQLGRYYFTSAGVNLDILGLIWHHVAYRSSLGFFHGFGEFGENRIVLSLESLLDI